MATNFPTSLDTLTNPTSSDSLSSPSHSAQHANVNDAVEALQAKVGVDGSAVTSSLDYKLANIGTWTTYTPTWTNVTVGNGTVDFSYSQIGKTVHLLGYFELGSTSSVSGSPLFSLPVTASSASVGRATNLCQVTDTGVRSYGVLCEVATTTTGALRVLGASLTTTNVENITATNPFTWTNTDVMRMSLTYRAA